ncbi:lysylphosphatidylglycerol synthase transmembrane domain-containing protein [uncultured Muribaculum sp.]|uniref:lysylphosphatidylglycerol synthase transmembrane domain-containing protein n=1 Tax=uncultured Muribaculum sp. TaxID=1918613 RepID=UPI0025F447F1|nr:lysylphosphatidylglycerol synthase transmembrane domain-containing protein [uncultured Muribaculum sp.]
MNAPASTPSSSHDIRYAFGRVLKVVVPLGISVVLVVWLFHKVDIARVEAIIRDGVDYRFIVAMMLVTMFSHMIRGIRWGIQLRAAGIPRMPVVAEYVSIFGAYALNLVFPFLGEGWRCVYVARRQQCRLSTVVGTDLGDRASDGVVIGLLIVLTLFVAHPSIDRFIDRYPIGEALDRYATDGLLWVCIVGVVALLAVCGWIFRRTRAVQGMLASVRRMWSGFAVLFHMKGIGLYLILTMGIWICYFSETYLCFYAFPFTRALIEQPGSCLGLVPGLVVFVFGSCSMIVPSNGGLGPWNIAVMFALTLFGVSDSDGAAYSIVCWSFQSAMLVALGIFSALYIMIHRRSVRERVNGGMADTGVASTDKNS